MPDRDDPLAVTVVVNGVPSSYVKRDDPRFLAFEYMQQMAAAIDLLPRGPLRVVHLGAAGCALARYVAATRPGSRQIGVDLDTELLSHVRDWFDLPRAPELRLRAGDARAELARMRDASADVVIRDAFAPDTTPGHLQTLGFAQEVGRVLAPGGLYLANIADRAPLALARSEVATVRAAQPGPGAGLELFAEPGVLKGRRYGNLVLAATFDGPRPATAELDRSLRCLAVPATALRGAELDRFAGTAPILTDRPTGVAAPADESARDDRTTAADAAETVSD